MTHPTITARSNSGHYTSQLGDAHTAVGVDPSLQWTEKTITVMVTLTF